MSGPSTRSHRSSVCEMDLTLAELSQMVKAGKSVVLITGAGLSAASGEFRYPFTDRLHSLYLLYQLSVEQPRCRFPTEESIDGNLVRSSPAGNTHSTVAIVALLQRIAPASTHHAAGAARFHAVSL